MLAALFALLAVGVSPPADSSSRPDPEGPEVRGQKQTPLALEREGSGVRGQKQTPLALEGEGSGVRGQPHDKHCGSFLYQPSYCLDFELRGPAKPYLPQPGDIMLSTDTSTFWKVMHNLAGTGHPTHSGIVFARPDGTLAIIEAGPHDTYYCRVLDCMPHLESYAAVGRVWLRRRTVPLTADQSARLTEFAMANDGRRFALGRLGLQLTPFRTRGPLRTAHVGRPQGIRQSYFCSELAMECLVASGLVDAATARPSATYPRDMFMDRSPNPYLNGTLKLAPDWDPPARWTPHADWIAAEAQNNKEK
ncbi:MAG: hypothetical protein L0Y72_24025 [Gemmataceae bacterium]|nr:hypothetical protein [Gemmataceae bacterium]MCI0742114.1 hypothetical protein [Gemmataceae bacterium]